MLFRTFEVYNDDYENEKTICFICYEIKYEQTITLNLQNDYIKNCYCNGWIHDTCLNKWYDKSSKCPICRKNVCKKTTFYMIFLENGKCYFTIFYINFFKNINKLIKYFLYLSFIYYATEFYLIVLNVIYYNKNYKAEEPHIL